MAIHSENGRNYSGAGVVIIEDYYTKDGTIEPAVVFVRNKRSGLFMDFGGIFEALDKTLNVTAHNELLEESINLFNIAPNNFIESVDIPVTRSNKFFYKVFLIKINGISKKYFLHNLKVVNKSHSIGNKVPISWRETDMIAHIPIKNIEFDKLLEHGKVIIPDVDSHEVMLHGRAKKALFYLHDMIQNSIKKKPLAQRKDIMIDNSDSFTNNTYSYKIS